MAGQIIKRGDRTWLVRIAMGRGTDGKRRYLNKTIHGAKKDAEKYLNKTLTAISTGDFFEPSQDSLKVYLEKWLKTAARPRLRDNTFEQYEWLIGRYVVPALGESRLSDLRPLDVQKMVTEMSERGLSPRTVRFTFTVLSSALRQAVRWRQLQSNPCEAVELPRKVTKEMKALTPEEAARFLDHAKTDRWYALFLVAIMCGLRPSEYFGLKWSDIDFKNKVLTVQRSLIWHSLKSDGWYFSETKTQRSRRRIPLSASIVAALIHHKRKQNEERLLAGAHYEQHDLVFAKPDGRPLIRLNVANNHFRPILKKAELPEDLRLYDLRHTCASLLLSSNEHPKVISERLGHSSIGITMDVYGHLAPDMQQAASEKLEGMLGAQGGSKESQQN